MRAISKVLVVFMFTLSAFGISGAKVQSVNLDHSKATITILNTSNKDIVAYSVTISSTLSDGKIKISGHSEEAHPLISVGKTFEWVETLDSSVTRVAVKLTAVVYADETKEVVDPRVSLWVITTACTTTPTTR